MPVPRRLYLWLLAGSLAALTNLSCGDDATRPNETPDPGSIFDDGLLDNGNVELGDSLPTRWRSFATRPGAFTCDWAPEGSSGGRSLAVAVQANSDENAFAGWAQMVTPGIPVGKSLTLSAKVRINGVGPMGAILVLRGDAENPPAGMPEAFATTQYVRSIVGTADWATYEVNLPSVGADIRCLVVYLLLSAEAGTSRFDEVRLYSPSPEPSR